RSCQPSPITAPSRTITQPTRGFGVAVYRPRSASKSARAMNARSASVNAIIGSAGARALPADAFSRRLDFPQGIMEVGGILERPVDRRKADVGDLVELVELLHHHFPDLPRRDLALAEREHLRDDAVDRL